MDIYSGRVCYDEKVCGLTTSKFFREDGMAGSILEYRGAYPDKEEWALIYRIDRAYQRSTKTTTPLNHAQFELLNRHDNMFDGGLSTMNTDYTKVFSPEVKAIIAERTLEVLRETNDYDSAYQYQNYVTYACKGINDISNANLIPSVNEFLQSSFHEKFACFE